MCGEWARRITQADRDAAVNAARVAAALAGVVSKGARGGF